MILRGKLGRRVADGVTKSGWRQRAYSVGADQRHFFEQRPVRVGPSVIQVSEVVTAIEVIRSAIAVEVGREVVGELGALRSNDDRLEPFTRLHEEARAPILEPVRPVFVLE